MNTIAICPFGSEPFDQTGDLPAAGWPGAIKLDIPHLQDTQADPLGGGFDHRSAVNGANPYDVPEHEPGKTKWFATRVDFAMEETT